MSLFSRPNNPPWLDTAREFCKAHDITIMGWGPHSLVVEAQSRNSLLKFLPNSPILAFNPSRTQAMTPLAF